MSPHHWERELPCPRCAAKSFAIRHFEAEIARLTFELSTKSKRVEDLERAVAFATMEIRRHSKWNGQGYEQQHIIAPFAKRIHDNLDQILNKVGE